MSSTALKLSLPLGVGSMALGLQVTSASTVGVVGDMTKSEAVTTMAHSLIVEVAAAAKVEAEAEAGVEVEGVGEDVEWKAERHISLGCTESYGVVTPLNPGVREATLMTAKKSKRKTKCRKMRTAMRISS